MKRVFFVIAGMAICMVVARYAVAQTADVPSNAASQQSRAQRDALDAIRDRLTFAAYDDRGIPAWLQGDLGAAVGSPRSAAIQGARGLGAALRLGADDDFDASDEGFVDTSGERHVRLQQTYRGLRVEGGDLVVHSQGNRLVGLNGRFVPGIDIGLRPSLSSGEALAVAGRTLGVSAVELIAAPALTVYAGGPDAPRLAWRQDVAYGTGKGMRFDRLFIDASDGAILAYQPFIMDAKTRKIYDGKNQCDSTPPLTTLPGTWLFGEGGSSSDKAAQAAYDNTGAVYDFYKAVFNRDSFDNWGAYLISTVHTKTIGGGCETDNASFIDYRDAQGNSLVPYPQMAYGDGNGTTTRSYAYALDVTGHEITHGVVTYSGAKLNSGGFAYAINEATADVLGQSAETWKTGAANWTLGEGIYNPPATGYVRSMSNPTAKGGADYYPERQQQGCSVPTAGNDLCASHANAGIADLAFYLSSQGGKHPRGKTSVSVNGIGISKAQQAWYKALTAYMIPGEDFQRLRNDTALAAGAIAGGSCSAEFQSFHKAWDAVGVPGTWTQGLQVGRFANCSIDQTVVDAFNRNGGVAAMGSPVNAVHAWGSSQVQDLAGGSRGAAIIIHGPGQAGAGAVWGQFWTRYRDDFGGIGNMGYPVNNGSGYDIHKWGSGDAQDYRGGVFADCTLLKGGAATKPYLLGQMRGKYIAVGGPASPLGFPTADAVAAPKSKVSGITGQAQMFEHGLIDLSSYGAWMVYYGMFDKYKAIGYSASNMGFPTSDEGDANRSGYSGMAGRFQKFEGGIMNWTSAYGTQRVRGAILTKFAQIGYSGSRCGFPKNEEHSCYSGMCQDFEGGYIYSYSAATDAHCP